MEHVPYKDVPAMMREWFQTLRPGGRLTVVVPDGEKYMRSFIEFVDEGKDDTFEMTYIHNGLFGDELRDGQIHQSIYTERSLMALAETSGFVEVKVERLEMEGVEGVVPKVGHLILTAKRGD
jgi:predicted SAM-dependent methyltransferase